MDSSIDFAAMYKDFDTAVMGRKTYEVLTAQGGNGALPGLDEEGRARDRQTSGNHAADGVHKEGGARE